MAETAPYYARPFTDSESRMWATLVHAGGVLFHFLPALIGYLVLRDRGAYIRQETRSALNFQLTVLVGYVIGIFTSWLIIGLFVLFAVWAINVVFCILAAVASSKGEHWAYPVTIKFIPA